MIKSKDISVVVQGPIYDYTIKCLNSIRKHLPKAKIILSTWENSNLDGLNFDEVILNKDPGHAYDADPLLYPKIDHNNVNRQILSSINGIKKAKTKYILKMRTDFIVKGNGFLKYFDKYKKNTGKAKVFDKKIICFSGTPSEILPFSICDFLFFGLREDMIKLFDIPLQPKNEDFYFRDHKPINEKAYKKNRFFPRCLSLYSRKLYYSFLSR